MKNIENKTKKKRGPQKRRHLNQKISETNRERRLSLKGRKKEKGKRLEGRRRLEMVRQQNKGIRPNDRGRLFVSNKSCYSCYFAVTIYPTCLNFLITPFVLDFVLDNRTLELSCLQFDNQYDLCLSFMISTLI